MKFNSLRAAMEFADFVFCAPLFVVVGDDGLYWVVTPRMADWLVDLGYELA